MESKSVFLLPNGFELPASFKIAVELYLYTSQTQNNESHKYVGFLAYLKLSDLVNQTHLPELFTGFQKIIIRSISDDLSIFHHIDRITIFYGG